MGASNYQGWQPANAPTFLARPYGKAWLAAHGLVKDYLVQRLQWSIKARFAALAPPDALAAIGNERGIIRGLNESNANYAVRVQQAWTAWPWAGTAYGVLSQLWAIGYTSSVIISRGLTYTLNASGSLNTPTSQPQEVNPYWSKFVVVVPHPWPSWWLSSGNWASPIHVGSGTGTLSAIAGVPNPDTDYVVKISTGGAVGAAQYKVSTDKGVTFGSATTIAASGNVLGGGPTFSASGTFVLNDLYFLSQIPPNDSSADANIFRAVLSTWKPANAKCMSITVLQTGWLWGYPSYTWGGTHPPWGGCSVQAWTPPTN